MGVKFNHSLHLFIFLFLLVPLDSCSQLLPSSSKQVQIVAIAPSTVPGQYQDLSVKSTTPLSLNEQHGKKKNMERRNMKREKFGARSFSAMLPKGYIPPSGSSPCHNGDPHSFTFYCDLSTP
ncbi:hypothetical protein NMG60_11015133 [Bertholletia excelsa]